MKAAKAAETIPWIGKRPKNQSESESRLKELKI
jgi:hypothetical protein